MTDKTCGNCAHWNQCLFPFNTTGNCDALSAPDSPLTISADMGAGSDDYPESYVVATPANFSCSKHQEKTQ